jgi:small subunit ribosomal protein S16
VAVKIRLKRLGKTRAPHYRIVVADSRTKRDGRAIEEIGRYVPTEHPSIIEVNSERAQYWLSVGAQPTEQVMALLKLTGDYQTSKGEKGVNKVQVKDAKVEFVIDTKKKPVLLPKEEKKAKAEVVAAETAEVSVSEEAAAEVVEEVAAEAAVAEEIAAEEVAVEEAPAAETAEVSVSEEAPVAEAEEPAAEAEAPAEEA